MSDALTIGIIGLTVVSIVLVALAAWLSVPGAIADHDGGVPHDDRDRAL